MEGDEEPTRQVLTTSCLQGGICPKTRLLDSFYISRTLSLREVAPHAVSHGVMLSIQTQVYWPTESEGWVVPVWWLMVPNDQDSLWGKDGKHALYLTPSPSSEPVPVGPGNWVRQIKYTKPSLCLTVLSTCLPRPWTAGSHQMGGGC